MKPTATVSGMGDDLVARDRALAGDEVEHAGRQVGLGEALGEQAGADAVLGAGVQTTVLPTASAGATISAGIVYGQFHGVTTATGPFGRRIRSTCVPGVDARRDRALDAACPSSAAPRSMATSSSTSS